MQLILRFAALQRTMECHPDFINLTTKLSSLKTMVMMYKTPEDANLQARLEAIVMCVAAGSYLPFPETNSNAVASISSRSPCRGRMRVSYSVGPLNR